MVQTQSGNKWVYHPVSFEEILLSQGCMCADYFCLVIQKFDIVILHWTQMFCLLPLHIVYNLYI